MNIMHIYRKVCFVIVLHAVYLRATVSGNCSVPLVQNGEIQKLRNEQFNPDLRSMERDSSPLNMTVGTSASENAEYLLSCNEGYSLQARGIRWQSINCSEGKWSPDPVCLENILCPKIDGGNEFDIKYTGDIKVGSYATYSCKDETKAITYPNYYVRCQLSGEWTHINPECKNNICPLIEVNDTFTIRYSKQRRVLSHAYFSCTDDSKVIVGRRSVKCNSDAKWTLLNPVCKDILCPQIDENNTFTIVYSDKRKVSSIATFYCRDVNHKIYGVPFVTCLNSANWTELQVECKDIICPLIDANDTFDIVYSDGTKVNSNATFNCKDVNQEIAGVRFATCQPSGEWTFHNPECRVYTCAVKDFSEIAPKNMVLDLEGVCEDEPPVGLELPLLCDGNMIISGNTKANCGRGGKWIYERAQCVIPEPVSQMKEAQEDNQRVPLIWTLLSPEIPVSRLDPPRMYTAPSGRPAAVGPYYFPRRQVIQYSHSIFRGTDRFRRPWGAGTRY